MAFCGKCGATLTKETGFCGSCGAAFNTTAQAGSVTGAGNGEWAPSPQQPGAASSGSSWSPVANQQPQGAGWSHVQAQPSVQAQTPAAQSWNATQPASSGRPDPNRAPVSSAPASAIPVAAPAGPVSGATPAGASTGSGLTPNVAAALAYVLGIITGVLFLVLEPYRRDKFVRFHAMQSILYFVAAVAFNIVWSIGVGILMHISGLFALASIPIRLLISLGFFCLWLFLMFQAYSGREFGIPILGQIARKQADSQG
jgi:uncharacterized membrane protein